jgi:hypothetical protein
VHAAACLKFKKIGELNVLFLFSHFVKQFPAELHSGAVD